MLASVSPPLDCWQWFELGTIVVGAIVLGVLWVLSRPKAERLRPIVWRLLPLCLSTLVPFAYHKVIDLRAEGERERAEQATTARKVAGRLTDFRTTLMQFATLCAPAAAGTTGRKCDVDEVRARLATPPCVERIERLEREWTDASWYLGMRSLDLLSSKLWCGDEKREPSGACAMLKLGVLDAVSGKYQTFLDAYRKFRAGDSDAAAIGRTAQSLYLTSRELSCAVAVAGYPRGDDEIKVPPGHCSYAFDVAKGRPVQNNAAGTGQTPSKTIDSWPLYQSNKDPDWSSWWKPEGCD